ncbi:hypothetical protein YC2023_053192 [Brassica napus]
MFSALALACHNKYKSYRSEPKIVVAVSINPTLLIASRNMLRRKKASLLFNKDQYELMRCDYPSIINRLSMTNKTEEDQCDSRDVVVSLEPNTHQSKRGETKEILFI